MGVKAAIWERASVLDGIYLTTPYDQGFVDALKAGVPRDFRHWDADSKRWYIHSDYEKEALDLARRHFQTVQEFRKPSDQRTAGGQQTWQTFPNGNFRWRVSANPAPAPSSPDHAALYVTPDAPPAVVRAAYKALAGLVHPDKGGDTGKMQAINSAFDRLKKQGKA